jgi:endonuclease-8
MPEGDSIFKAARTLQRALGGQLVTRFQTGLVKLARADDQEPIAGRTLERVEAAGKHLLMTFSGDLVLRTHMRMNGSWHVYRPGERWQAPARDMRIVIETADWVAVAFRVHEAEFVRADEVVRRTPVGELGPDLLNPAFVADEALRRMRALADRPIGEVLLNQRVLAGIGNIYRNEVLFMAGQHPDTPTGSLNDDELRGMIAIARRLLQENVAERPGPGAPDARSPARWGGGPMMVTYPGYRRTTRRMKPEDRFWVYARSGRPCRKCGAAIAFRKTGDDARVTYWCPTCQPVRRG